ncbi:hypothetical protein [Jeotgalibacillus proteolyticus]|uniref:DUF4367 domain-containing protein n=1 Tax=Jeotgalibacillus proteolyticus TaxID=2082395 RepID=A0A2S5GGS5_9BACL|nr:hypothetical protein [Jeotgalibacillus proteolyticus]PPA72237.1 hypothetical protein C4B60_02340 [Jeotgalibacillus proteolyticus]
MIKHHLFHIAAVLLLLCLTACGTDNQSSADRGSENQEENGQQEETEDAGQEIEEDSIIRLLEQLVQFELHGEEIEKTAFLQESRENNYSLYVIDGFTFTGSELGTDQIVYDQDASQMMQIQSYPADTAEEEELDSLAYSYAEASSSEIPEAWEPSEEYSFPDNTAGYQSSSDSEETLSFYFEKNNKVMAISITITKDFGSTDAFLKMAETIE